jgi:DNA-binding beta-propeller fold protein YncE
MKGSLCPPFCLLPSAFCPPICARDAFSDSVRVMILFAILAALHVTAHVAPLSGDTGWDYITADPAMHRVFVAHGDRITVIDSSTHKEIGTIPANGAHGVALAPDLKKGFSSNGRGNDVTVFDYESLKPLASWKATGENPDAILYDAESKHLFTFNGRGKNATVFDATSGEVLGTIPMGGKPEFAQSDEKGHVYVNGEDTNEMIEIDARGGKISRRWPLTGCESPSGLAIDRGHRRLFSVCGNKIMAISDIDAGKVVVTAPIGQGVDGVACDADRGLAFSANGRDGNITVVSASDGKVVSTIPSALGARTIAIDEKTHRLYLPTAKFAPPEKPGDRPKMVAGSFEVIEVGE